jgi:HD-like signal output (HDOD) protein
MKSEKAERSLSDIFKEHVASEQLKLPVFPRVALELQEMLADDDVPMDRIANVLGKDQALASEVLKQANSAFYSGMRAVQTIQDAIMRLGSNQVFNYLVSGGQRQYYRSQNDTINKYYQILWKHALATATGSKWLLERIGCRSLANEGFLAGLMHDIGKLLLLKVLGSMSAENGEVKLTDQFIAKVLRSMHVEHGYGLMNQWSIPPIYSDVVRDHHKEDFDPADKLLMVVRIVNQVTRKSGMSTNCDVEIVPSSLPEVLALGVEEDLLTDLETVINDAALNDSQP